MPTEGECPNNLIGLDHMNSLDTDYNSIYPDRRPKIMAVDDDEINTAVICALLGEEYDIIPANSGREAFRKLREQLPDLILLDMHMPEMSGHDVIRVLKQHHVYADIPVVFLTADDNTEAEVQGLSEGAEDFIRKPLCKDVAMARINMQLRLNHLQNNLKQEVARQTQIAEKQLESFERMSVQMVTALANTIDAVDSYTNGHSVRVAKYTIMLAERMGYTGDRLTCCQFAALLHDIGKIGVPAEIINKTSKLTDEEYAIIKTHPAIGGNILAGVTEIPDISTGARYHHERYDGKGYPDGLSGEDIPEIARIIGVADAYDAMTSKRSYRGILSQERVREEIERGKGTQHDPYISDIMINLIDEDTGYKMHE